MNTRKFIVKSVTFLAGLYFFLEYVLPEALLEFAGVAQSHESITNGFITVGIMAVGLGLINLLRVYGSRIVFRRKGWLNATALLTSLVCMLTVTIGDWLSQEAIGADSGRYAHLASFASQIVKDTIDNPSGVPKRSERIDKLNEAAAELLKELEVEELSQQGLQFAESKDQLQHDSYLNELEEKVSKLESHFSAGSNMSNDELEALGRLLQEVGVVHGRINRLMYKYSGLSNFWRLLFDGLFVPLGAAMFSLLGVYIASAAFRAFRIRSWESALMMGAAVLVMLGQIPFGVWIYHGMPDIRDWILQVPNSAAFRAISIGTAIAGLVMAFRMWFSIESSFGSEDS